MATTSITLTDPVSGYSVAIMPGVPGVAAQSLEVEPIVRTITESRVGSHGSYDTTAYMDAAVVTLQLLLYDADSGPSQAAFLDSLGPLLQPSLRPYLIVTDSERAVPRQLTVRLDSMSKPRSDPTNWPVQIFWVAPNGVWEDAVTQTPVIPAVLPVAGGLDFSSVSNSGLHISSQGLRFAAGSLLGTEVLVTSAGTVASEWTALLYGPCSGPRLANDATGQTISFLSGLTVNAGDYVLIDSRARSAFLNGDITQPRLSFLDFANTRWWKLQPGQNTLRYNPVSAGSGAECQLTFRPAYTP